MEVNIEIKACINSFMLSQLFLEPVDCLCCIPFPLGFNGYTWKFVYLYMDSHSSGTSRCSNQGGVLELVLLHPLGLSIPKCVA